LIAAVVTIATLSTVNLPTDALSVEARIDANTLTVGPTYHVVIDLHWDKDLSASRAGLPAPILQMDVPKCVTLSGKHLTQYRELARNEFLQEPYERLIKDNPLPVGFVLNRTPASDDAFALNVIAYVERDGEKYFVRRRVVVPIAPGATGRNETPDRSNWGTESTLNIGDKADEFTLPRADGSKVALADYLGKTNVIVTTYRAFW